MTMTPEEQADGICASIARIEAAFDKRGWIEMPKADRDRYVQRASLAAPLIALAIREAEDAALERAAIVVQTKVSMKATTFAQAGEMLRDRNGDEHFLGAKSVNELIERKASDIRALKYNKD